MHDWKKVFEQGPGMYGPASDFEERVFAKIRRKKAQRRIGYAVMAVAGILLLLSLFQLFRPIPRDAMIARSDGAKEEIPVSEDLFFSASDSRTRYLLEPAAYRQKSTSREAAPNQI
jgi:hypothetical protein